jgi:hypothetical protein
VKSLCGPRRASDGIERIEVVAFDLALQPIRAKARKRYAKGDSQGSLI